MYWTRLRDRGHEPYQELKIFLWSLKYCGLTIYTFTFLSDRSHRGYNKKQWLTHSPKASLKISYLVMITTLYHLYSMKLLSLLVSSLSILSLLMASVHLLGALKKISWAAFLKLLKYIQWKTNKQKTKKHRSKTNKKKYITY